jgi:predicted CDP-diglyceride synthetase/phosphatidate cytidylyltransferase
MSSAEKRDPNRLKLGFIYGALVLWVFSFLAVRMLHHYPTNTKFRLAAVIIGVLGILVWQLVTAKLILLHDEFTRQIYLIAFAIAFAVTALFIWTVGLLQRAGFIDYVSMMTVFMVMSAAWCLAILGAEWYYRR